MPPEGTSYPSGQVPDTPPPRGPNALDRSPLTRKRGATRTQVSGAKITPSARLSLKTPASVASERWSAAGASRSKLYLISCPRDSRPKTYIVLLDGSDRVVVPCQ